MADETLACIGLGTNLGDGPTTLRAALGALAALPDTTLAAVSSTYRTAPIAAAGPDFFNAVAVLRTSLPPHALLAQLQHIEQRHGRVRSVQNAPRTLDLDLLLYGEQRIADAQLTVPHPRLHERAFVLRPLADVMPNAVIPGRGPLSQWLPTVAHQRIEKVDA